MVNTIKKIHPNYVSIIKIGAFYKVYSKRHSKSMSFTIYANELKFYQKTTCKIIFCIISYNRKNILYKGGTIWKILKWILKMQDYLKKM